MEGAFGAGKAGTDFNPVEFVQRPQVILRLLNILFSIIVFGSISSKGWTFDTKKEICLYNSDANACNYGVGIGVIAFLAAATLLAGEYFFPQMSSVKTRRHYVLGDLAFSGFWAFLYGVGFIYLASQWTKTDSSPAALAAGNNLRAAITFSFFSIFTWAGSSFFAYQRYRQGAESAFATAYETGMGGPGGATTPGSAGGYTSFPGMGTTADPIGGGMGGGMGGGAGGAGGYQGPPFSSAARPGTIGDYQPPTY
ncbi:synaptogyrin-1-like [Daphnia pulicaria]|uniref:synaptogyrin-1-like n=1 Tax=Daphnia pulicaria TaxID=35523 RepID=UPI001EE9B04A|nr:synaptogyrin-1-like [Daphnia pulicaria]